MTSYTLREIASDDFVRWRDLFAQYCTFYETDFSDEKADTVWGWLQDPAHPEEGRLLCADDEVIGLLHFRPQPLTLIGGDVGFVDDLFIDPAARGRGLGAFVAEQLTDIARDRGWPSLQWLTADDNYRGRTLYDRFAKRTMWITYELDLE
ncbi:MAG: GNAT family N-acetyltransferase [Candidatus Nanopelagicales bacterium]